MGSIEIINVPRQTGNTTWILKSALTNREVIIVVSALCVVQEYKTRFIELMVENEIEITNEQIHNFMYNPRRHNYFRDDFKMPEIMTLKNFNSIMESSKLPIKGPIIFDNSCFCVPQGVLFKEPTRL